jgi:alpha-tubulin suppressor-like RCC1 family protein
MPVFDTSIKTKFVDGSTDLGGKGWVLKDYIIDVYPNLAPYVKTPALWLWGSNSAGQLGNNTSINTSSPVQTITGGSSWKQIACGYGFTAAIKTDGTLWLWGKNDDFVRGTGVLGDNTVVAKSSPVQIVTGGTWTQVAGGYWHAAAIKTDGTLWTWGGNLVGGPLGDNTTISKSSPVQTITRGTNWSKVACGGRSTYAIKTDGTLWTWGTNYDGRLGDNTTTRRFSPVQTAAGGTNWSQVASSGNGNGYGHCAAIKTDGTLWLWGLNYSGQLGDNTVVSKSSPVQTVTGGTNWKQVSCGGAHTAAVKTDGTLWTWGGNSYGNGLGDNTTTNRSSPVQTITGGTNWKQVACGNSSNSAAIKTDGTLWGWGQNYGQLGDNTTTGRSSPVQTIMRGTNWKSVACGAYNTVAIADGNY